MTDRFSSKEEIEWAEGPFWDGHRARCDGQPLRSAPSADVIGEHARKSWLAGWSDADQAITADAYLDF